MKNTLIWKDQYDFYYLLEKLDQAGHGFLVIIDENNILMGMVTDGDIRRAVLNKKSDILEIINTNPITVNEGTDRIDIIKMLHKIQRRQIPVVNTERKLIDIIYLEDDDYHFNNNYIVIMAGGLGSRLGELTKDTPKPMLHVGGRPILENIILAFREYGYNKFILCVSYKSEVIEDYFENGSKWGVEIVYNHEDRKMGTAGALSLIENKFEEPFFVVNGDILTAIDFHEFMEFHRKSKALATMCLKKFDFQIPYACINTSDSGEILSLVEKPVMDYSINAGMYILDPAVIDFIPSNSYYDMTTLFDDLIQRKEKVLGYNLNEYWLDVGHKADYYKANNDFKLSQ